MHVKYIGRRQFGWHRKYENRNLKYGWQMLNRLDSTVGQQLISSLTQSVTTTHPWSQLGVLLYFLTVTLFSFATLFYFSMQWLHLATFFVVQVLYFVAIEHTFFNDHYIPTCQSFGVVTHAIFSLSICTSLLWHLWIIFKQHRKYIFSPHHPPFTKCSAQCTSPILSSWPLSKLGKLIKFALL